MRKPKPCNEAMSKVKDLNWPAEFSMEIADLDRLIKKYKFKEALPLAEVLLLTGHASVETSIEGMKLGAFDYLMKPIKLEELLTELAQAFEKKDTHDQKIRTARIKDLIRFPGRVLEQMKEKKAKRL
jgi:DNA-binding NtrC family response regulator